MNRLILVENESFLRSDLAPAALASLQHLCERCGADPLDWGYRDRVVARNHVGVLRVPGLTVEILPKIDAAPPHPGAGVRTLPDANAVPDPGSGIRGLARGNLLYMLSVAGVLSLPEADLAALDTRRFPLWELFALLFAKRLLRELRSGLEHGYVTREENLRHFRGKLLLTEHLRRNAADAARLYVRYEEFIADTSLNRILKNACGALLDRCRSIGTVATTAVERPLREALAHFAEVDDVDVRDADFDGLGTDRRTRRFRPLLDFCRLLRRGRCPVMGTGAHDTFSLLIPMDRLWEAFVAAYLRRHARALGLSAPDIHIQGGGNRHPLLSEPETGREHAWLRPDILLRDPNASDRYRIVLDTKWKRVGGDDDRLGAGGHDLYQMHAYTHYYRADLGLLLYPNAAGASSRTFHWRNRQGPTHARLRVGVLDLSNDLLKGDHTRFKADLRRLLIP